MSASFFASICAAFGRYDVVHFHAEGPCATLWLPKLMGKRCIATVHGLDHRRSKWGRLARTYIMLGEKCAVRFADAIIVLNRSNQEYFLNNYGRETLLIPNGVTCPEKREACEIREKYGLEKDGYLLYLGRIVPEKGIHYLIEAFGRTDTGKKLVIAGGASDSADYFDRIRGLARDDKRIVFTGFVEGRVLEELYSNAYVYVLPSDLEGMPLSLLEAMSYGNCCVVSDIPECTEVVEDHGISFERTSVSALRSVLQALCDDAARVNEYRRTAAGFITGKYNWDEVTRRTLEVYEQN